MVSKARLLLPEPDRPVKTIMRLRGRVTLTFFRLCSRAPFTMMESCMEEPPLLLMNGCNYSTYVRI